MGLSQTRLANFAFDYDWRIDLMNEPREPEKTEQTSIWRWVRPLGQQPLTAYN